MAQNTKHTIKDLFSAEYPKRNIAHWLQFDMYMEKETHFCFMHKAFQMASLDNICSLHFLKHLFLN